MNTFPDALLTALFPSTCPVQRKAVTVEQETLHLRLTTTAPTACCPLCAAPSSAVHSRYQRHLADLPWGPLAVRLPLTAAQQQRPAPGVTIYERIHALHAQGTPITAIAQQLGVSRPTVYAYLRRDMPPPQLECAATNVYQCHADRFRSHGLAHAIPHG